MRHSNGADVTRSARDSDCGIDGSMSKAIAAVVRLCRSKRKSQYDQRRVDGS